MTKQPEPDEAPTPFGDLLSVNVSDAPILTPAQVREKIAAAEHVKEIARGSNVPVNAEQTVHPQLRMSKFAPKRVDEES